MVSIPRQAPFEEFAGQQRQHVLRDHQPVGQRPGSPQDRCTHIPDFCPRIETNIALAKQAEGYEWKEVGGGSVSNA